MKIIGKGNVGYLGDFNLKWPKLKKLNSIYVLAQKIK